MRIGGWAVDLREAGLGAVAILLGIAVAVGATGFAGGSTYDVLGPRLLPYMIAAGLVLTGLPILIGAIRRGRAGARAEPWDAAPVLLIVIALIIPITLIRIIGWIPVAAVVFALGARAFGSRTTLLDLGIGLAFGAVSFLLFSYALGLNLPLGSLLTGFRGD